MGTPTKRPVTERRVTKRQLQDVQLKDIQLQDVNLTKRPVYQMSRLQNVQVTVNVWQRCEFHSVHNTV